MSEPLVNYQKLCADLLDAIGASLYLMEIKHDPACAAELLRAAQERAGKDYLSCCGPVYDGGALDTSFNS